MQKTEDIGMRRGSKIAKYCVFNDLYTHKDAKLEDFVAFLKTILDMQNLKKNHKDIFRAAGVIKAVC